MTCIMPCKVVMISQRCRYCFWAQRAEDAERSTNTHSRSYTYNAGTLLPPSSSRKHPHAREAASPRFIGACNPSPRKDRLTHYAIHHRGKIGLHTMIAGGADACTLITRHRQKLTATRAPSRVCRVNFCQLFVVLAAAARS